jgi:hypothetical protein
MNATLATATATTTATIIDHIGPRPTAIRQRPQQTRNQPATTSNDIHRSRHHDFCTYFSTMAAAVTTTKMLKVNIYTAVVGFFLAVVAPTALAEQRIHFFGNSYTSFSGGLEKMVRALLEESLSVTIYAKRTTRNGARLSTHLSYARE